MDPFERFSELVKVQWKSLEYAKNGVASASDIQRWMDLNSQALRILRNLVNSKKLTRAHKQKLQTILTHLLTIQNKLRGYLKLGGEVRMPSAVEIPNNQEPKDLIKWDDMPSAFERRIRSGVISNLGHLDVVSFMDDARTLFESKIKSALQEYNALKVNAELSAEFIIQKSDSVSAEVKYFNTENVSIFATTDLVQCFNDKIKQPILRQMEEFEEKDSGWSLREILSLTININKLNPMRGTLNYPM